MILSDTTPNRIYLAIMTKPFWFNFSKSIWTTFSPQDPPIEILFLTIKNENKNLVYETLAASKDIPFATIPLKHPVEEIFPDALPLFINFPYKSQNFENLLKGDPLTDSSLHTTIQVRLKPQDKE
jgi:hypothetical protein